MDVSSVCNGYFSGFQDLCHFSDNSAKKNGLALLKIISYPTFIIPLGFGVAYGCSSLCCRVNHPSSLSSQECSINDQAKKSFNLVNEDCPSEYLLDEADPFERYEDYDFDY